MTAISAVLAACGALSCSSGGGGFPSIEGWTQAGEVRVYDADNLWEYINGAAELFVAYDVQTCETADLSSGDVVVTLDLYDMGTPLNAFGIFSRERSGERVAVPEATDAMISPPYLAMLVKGTTYAKVNVLEGELTEEVGHALLEALALELPGEPAYPAEFGRLPTGGRIAGTEGYQRDGYLGLTELTQCLYAEYSRGEETWESFVMLSTWDALAGRWDALDHGGEQVLYREIPYRGFVGVKQTEQGILGVSGAADLATLLSQLDTFAQ